MTKKLILIITLGVTLSGCFMAPIALIGPAASGFTTASIMQSGITSGANYMVKKSTGKSITQHALDQISKDTLQHTYFPQKKISGLKISHYSSLKIPHYSGLKIPH